MGKSDQTVSGAALACTLLMLGYAVFTINIWGIALWSFLSCAIVTMLSRPKALLSISNRVQARK
jgi:hypothetical protein